MGTYNRLGRPDLLLLLAYYRADEPGIQRHPPGAREQTDGHGDVQDGAQQRGASVRRRRAHAALRLRHCLDVLSAFRSQPFHRCYSARHLTIANRLLHSNGQAHSAHPSCAVPSIARHRLSPPSLAGCLMPCRVTPSRPMQMCCRRLISERDQAVHCMIEQRSLNVLHEIPHSYVPSEFSAEYRSYYIVIRTCSAVERKSFPTTGYHLYTCSSTKERINAF